MGRLSRMARMVRMGRIGGGNKPSLLSRLETNLRRKLVKRERERQRQQKKDDQ